MLMLSLAHAPPICRPDWYPNWYGATNCPSDTKFVGVKCPDIWVFGKIAYLPTTRPTMTTILVQSKQPTYLPPRRSRAS